MFCRKNNIFIFVVVKITKFRKWKTNFKDALFLIYYNPNYIFVFIEINSRGDYINNRTINY